MATFSESDFPTQSYNTFRPRCPKALFEYVFEYHRQSKNAQWELAVDLGCGTGQVTAELLPYFALAIGVDPSENMMRVAREAHAGKGIEFIHGVAENLHFLADRSVDLLVAGQAVHWFNLHRAWPEFARVLRKGGSVAFWTYTEFRLVNHPDLSHLVKAYTHSSTLGPLWGTSGRKLIDDHLLDVLKATDVMPEGYSDWKNVLFTGNHYEISSGFSAESPRPTILRRRSTWAQLFGEIHMWSAQHKWDEAHKGSITPGGEGDIAMDLVKTLEERVRAAPAEGEGDYVEVEWPLGMVLVRRT